MTPRARAAVVVLMLLALGAGAAVARWYTQNESRSIRHQAQELAADLARTQQEVEQLQARLAVAERSGQVTDSANTELRDEIGTLQDEIAGLKADNEFYRRLLGTGGSGNGLAVHALQLQSTSSSRVFRFNLTLSQNLKKARVVAGEVELMIDGIREDRAVRLTRPDLELQSEGDGLDFEFKYFQQLGGQITLPEDFDPERITVRLVPERKGRKPVAREFIWPETSDARHPVELASAGNR